MAAYVIAILEQKKDAAELKTYFRAAPATFPPSAKPLAAYGKFEVLEGDAAEGAVILEFPSFKEAKAWYESPAYQEAKAHRLKGGDYRMLIVEGR
jgi:uncharacterized protein (DUF1330 family)